MRRRDVAVAVFSCGDVAEGAKMRESPCTPTTVQTRVFFEGDTTSTRVPTSRVLELCSVVRISLASCVAPQEPYKKR